MAENYDPDAVNLQIRTKVTQCNVELKQQLRISLWLGKTTKDFIGQLSECFGYMLTAGQQSSI
jgi:hypothetical protein